ncbi:hypothetical protein E4U42_004162 [Claviceps africana]|uniref:endo-1,3(4)-beta-glucanase n=1 Tax=Claviceps africana TaxID=83212 RepID=A0A8K0JBR8_9HYPO|nr:hypothetical protein E4U42_004162 [Claviceps africana]
MRLTNRLATLGGTVLVAAKAAQAGYQLETTYDTSNFFQGFDFFTGPDPTQGFVEYVNSDTAHNLGLAAYAKGGVFMGVDHQTQYPGNGRKSIRVESHKTFTHGLFIADIAHMPGSICGTWPAFWMFGSDWPKNGEIDILEGVNTQTKNTATLHTKPGCFVSNHGAMASTKFASADCGAEGTSAGCGQHTADNQNYGDGFNAAGGGVYATEWTSDHIAIWFFPRSKIPQDIKAENPKPSNWGTPVARFVGGPSCSIDGHFANNKLVIDTTFCGSWAGDPKIWNANPECSALAKTCKDYVSGNPAAFAEAFWVFNYIKVYQHGPGNDVEPTKPLPSATGARTNTTAPYGTNSTAPYRANSTASYMKPTGARLKPTPLPVQQQQQPPSPPQAQAPPQPQPTTPAQRVAAVPVVPSQPLQESPDGQIWNAQSPPASPASPPAPAPVDQAHGTPSTKNNWTGQPWNGLGWIAKRSSELVLNMFRG